MNIHSVIKRLRLREIFTLERSVCRLIAAWALFAAFTLGTDGNYLKLEFAQEVSTFYMCARIACAFLLFTVINYLLYRFETDSWALMLSATFMALRFAYLAEKSESEFLLTIAIIVAYSLFVFYFLHKNDILISKIKLSGKITVAAVAALGLISGGIIAAFGVARYLSFATPNFDFGLFCNMFHYMKETGLPLVTSERDVLLSHFAVHISPIYYIILPIYYILPSPITLQVAQAIILASGIIPVMLLCRKYCHSGKLTLLICALYAFYPALSGGCFYDIHENCFLAPLLLWMFWFFEREKYLFMYLFAVLTLAVKEDAAVYVVIFALFIFFSRKKRLHGSILALLAMLYFALALSLLSNYAEMYAQMYESATPCPAIHGPMINRFNNLIFDKESGLAGALKTLLVNPGYALSQLFSESDGGIDKLAYAAGMLLPLGLLPFCSKKASRWLLVAPILMNLLTNYVYQYDMGFQYSFAITAFLVWATVMNVGELSSPTKKNMLTVAAVCTAVLYVSSVLPFAVGYVNRYRQNAQTYQKMEEILDVIPKDSSVSASSFLLAHLSDRDEIYELRYHAKAADVDYVVFDLRYQVDQGIYNYYIANGYEELERHEKMILILYRGNAE